MNKSTLRLLLVALVIVPFALGLALGVYGFSDAGTDTATDLESPTLVEVSDNYYFVKTIGQKDKSGAECGSHIISLSNGPTSFVRVNTSQSGISEDALKGATAVKNYIDDGDPQTLQAGLSEAMYSTFSCGSDLWEVSVAKTKDRNGSSAFTGESFDGPEALTGRTALLMHDLDGEHRLQEVQFAKNGQYLYMFSNSTDLEYAQATESCDTQMGMSEAQRTFYSTCTEGIMKKAADKWLLEGDLSYFKMMFDVAQ